MYTLPDDVDNKYIIHFKTETDSNLGPGGHKILGESGCLSFDCLTDPDVLEDVLCQ